MVSVGLVFQEISFPYEQPTKYVHYLKIHVLEMLDFSAHLYLYWN